LPFDWAPDTDPEFAVASLFELLELVPILLLAAFVVSLAAPEIEPLFAVALLPLLLFRLVSCAKDGVAIVSAATATAPRSVAFIVDLLFSPQLQSC
jgi:hypothetical protein